MKRILMLVGVFTTVACSSLPPQTEAIHEALTTNLALRSATEQCAELDKMQAGKEYAQWWKRNRQGVLAADYGLLKLNWETSQQASEQQHAVLGMQMLELLMADSNAQVADWLGHPVSAKGCQKLFQRVDEGRLDLNRSRSNAKVLDALYQERTTVETDAERGRSVNARYRKYGRSLYLAEKALQKAGCRDPNLSMLRNSWPLEVYDAVCGQEDYVLVKCIWGRCDVKR